MIKFKDIVYPHNIFAMAASLQIYWHQPSKAYFNQTQIHVPGGKKVIKQMKSLWKHKRFYQLKMIL